MGVVCLDVSLDDGESMVVPTSNAVANVDAVDNDDNNDDDEADNALAPSNANADGNNDVPSCDSFLEARIGAFITPLARWPKWSAALSAALPPRSLVTRFTSSSARPLSISRVSMVFVLLDECHPSCCLSSVWTKVRLLAALDVIASRSSARREA